MAQYDHGIKEAAGRSVVFVICPDGIREERPALFRQKIKAAGGIYYEWNDHELPEYLSPLTSTIPFLFMADFLRKKLKVKDTVEGGNKITRIRD
jgi:hypothetical protein